jgi:hypothetical protein
LESGYRYEMGRILFPRIWENLADLRGPTVSEKFRLGLLSGRAGIPIGDPVRMARGQERVRELVRVVHRLAMGGDLLLEVGVGQGKSRPALAKAGRGIWGVW